MVRFSSFERNQFKLTVVKLVSTARSCHGRDLAGLFRRQESRNTMLVVTSIQTAFNSSRTVYEAAEAFTIWERFRPNQRDLNIIFAH
jgi:hypothetical protein